MHTFHPDMSREHPSSVETADGTIVALRPEPIGHGGEGTIYRAENGRSAVKILNTKSKNADVIALRLKRLAWLPLENIPVCRPVALLAPPHTGYTMELLEDMVALRAICGVPDKDFATWYAEGGGLRRRLVLLARCAEILSALHERGVVYGDVSPGNILISEHNDFDQVWLVDADNLRTETSVDDRRLGTPLYTAPEILRGTSGNTPATDMYSFAVVAYETLTTNHPLLGDFVADGPHELEDDAQLGLLPWIDHSTDLRNRSTVGLTASQVTTAALRDLFTRTFEDGMVEPRVRPAASEWASALWSAAGRTVRCTACRQTYLVVSQACQCGRPRPDVMVIHVAEHFQRVGEFHSDTVPIPEQTLVLQAGAELVVRARTTHVDAIDGDRNEITYTWHGDDTVEVRNVGQTVIRRVPPRGGIGQQFFPGVRVTDDRNAPWTLHFGSERERHRVLCLGTIGGGGGAR